MTEKYIKVVTKALEVVKRPPAKVKKFKKEEIVFCTGCALGIFVI